MSIPKGLQYVLKSEAPHSTVADRTGERRGWAPQRPWGEVDAGDPAACPPTQAQKASQLEREGHQVCNVRGARGHQAGGGSDFQKLICRRKRR